MPTHQLDSSSVLTCGLMRHADNTSPPLHHHNTLEIVHQQQMYRQGSPPMLVADQGQPGR